jgi:S-adenosyl-L-methionine hydrolase (adenosine-forming)
VEITSTVVTLRTLPRTFHGRDVFAPAAAHLAAGTPISELGPAVDPSSLMRAHVPEPEVEENELHAEVLGVDRFGNLQTSARAGHLDALQGGIEVVIGGSTIPVSRAETFDDVAEGQLAIIVDSAGWVAVVINRGSAAEALGLAAGEPITLRGTG